MRDEARWWFNTAEGDLSAARILFEAGRFNRCAFHAQQAAEKALKAVLESAARRLDLHYVQSRYPNGLGGDPTRYYDTSLAEECLDQSGRMLKFAQDQLDGGQ